MKNLILVILLSLFFLGCKNALPKIEARKQEQFKMMFAPSFIPFLTFTLNMEKDSAEVTYYVMRPRNPLTNVPPKTIVYDSVTINVGGEAYLRFVKTIREIDYKNYKSGREGANLIDGIYAQFQYVSITADTTKLSFESSNRKETKVAYELIDGFFQFAETIFKDNKNRMTYLRTLKKFFDYKLPPQ